MLVTCKPKACPAHQTPSASLTLSGLVLQSLTIYRSGGARKCCFSSPLINCLPQHNPEGLATQCSVIHLLLSWIHSHTPNRVLINGMEKHPRLQIEHVQHSLRYSEILLKTSFYTRSHISSTHEHVIGQSVVCKRLSTSVNPQRGKKVPLGVSANARKQGQLSTTSFRH